MARRVGVLVRAIDGRETDGHGPLPGSRRLPAAAGV